MSVKTAVKPVVKTETKVSSEIYPKVIFENNVLKLVNEKKECLIALYSVGQLSNFITLNNEKTPLKNQDIADAISRALK